jgi:hypothetical protein
MKQENARHFSFQRTQLPLEISTEQTGFLKVLTTKDDIRGHHRLLNRIRILTQTFEQMK